MSRALGVFALALAVRLAVALPALTRPELAYAASNDTPAYLRLARNVAEGHGFTADTLEPRAPDVFRVPGFPLYLALPHALGAPVRGGVLLNALLGALTALFVLLLARRAFGERAGFVAGVLAATAPTAVFYASLVFSETLFAFFVALFALALFAWRRAQSPLFAVLAGAAVGLSALVRPVGVVLLPALVLPAFSAGRLSRRLALVALALVVALGTLSPWVARNRRAARFTGLTTVADLNLLLYGAARTRAFTTGEDVGAARRHLVGELVREGLPADSLAPFGIRSRPEWAGAVRAKALAVIAEHPLVYVALYAKGLALTAVGVPTDLLSLVVTGDIGTTEGRFLMEIARQPPWLTASWAVWLAFVLVLYGGVVLSLRSRPARADVLVLLAVCLLLTVVVGVGGYARFRAPVEPLLAAAAAPGLLRLLPSRS